MGKSYRNSRRFDDWDDDYNSKIKNKRIAESKFRKERRARKTISESGYESDYDEDDD